MKIFKLPQGDHKSLGPKRVHSKKQKLEKQGQLNLFSSGRILHLKPLSLFEEALLMDERGDLESAKKLYTKAIEMENAPADALCNLGIITFGEKDYPKAINYFTRCLKHNPRHYEAHFNLANTYAEVGNIDLAIIHYEVSIEIEPSFPSSYFNLGLTLAKDQKYSEAIQAFNKFLAFAHPKEHRAGREVIRKLQLMASSES